MNWIFFEGGSKDKIGQQFIQIGQNKELYTLGNLLHNNFQMTNLKELNAYF